MKPLFSVNGLGVNIKEKVPNVRNSCPPFLRFIPYRRNYHSYNKLFYGRLIIKSVAS
jgi:hypothetical protein